MEFLRRTKAFITYCNWKTLYFNIHYLPFRNALLFPVFVSRNIRFVSVKGSVKIKGHLKPGMIRIGTNANGLFARKSNRPVWENKGRIIFQGNATIKYGAKIISG